MIRYTKATIFGHNDENKRQLVTNDNKYKDMLYSGQVFVFHLSKLMWPDFFRLQPKKNYFYLLNVMEILRHIIFSEWNAYIYSVYSISK
jgi:hypothetical protein